MSERLRALFIGKAVAIVIHPGSLSQLVLRELGLGPDSLALISNRTSGLKFAGDNVS